ncbi:MAG: glutamine synthetase type III, partial [Oscillospiraceae bacterium]|nr:glutamine synthetase type III [Oscillospiraceae bacterium]
PYIGAERTQMKLGVNALPRFTKETTDRNRTSPFAFTGNKFEFRMLGSSSSIASTNIMLNSAVAEVLDQFAHELESASCFTDSLHNLIRRTVAEHKRIIFNGDGYDDAWIREAVYERGLLNLPTTADAMPYLLDRKNMDMLIRHNVFTEAEIYSRYEIQVEKYCKSVRIEALTMADMARKEILPAVESYISFIAGAASAKLRVDSELSCRYEKKTLHHMTSLAERIDTKIEDLLRAVKKQDAASDITEASKLVRDEVIPNMSELRARCDEAEALTAREYWPFPTYGDLLFGI